MKLHTDIVPGTEIPPEQWDAFVHNSPQGSIYVLHGYATAIKPGWQAAIVKNEAGWQAVMPFYMSKKWGLKAILQPLFAQYWGILFAESTFDLHHRRTEWEKAVIGQLLPLCEAAHLYAMHFSPAFTYPHPFLWKGYQVAARYTQVLDLSPAEDALFAHLVGSLRRQIRKGESQALQCRESADVEELIKLILLNHARGNRILDSPARDAETLRRIAAFLQTTGQGWVWHCCDEKGQVLAAGIWAVFRGRMMYLIGAYHPDHRDRGAMSWLMWQAICRAKKQGLRTFDFEGSMVESIEHFFRKFNASYEVYFLLRKNQLPLPIRWTHEFV